MTTLGDPFLYAPPSLTTLCGCWKPRPLVNNPHSFPPALHYTPFARPPPPEPDNFGRTGNLGGGLTTFVGHSRPPNSTNSNTNAPREVTIGRLREAIVWWGAGARPRGSHGRGHRPHPPPPNAFRPELCCQTPLLSVKKPCGRFDVLFRPRRCNQPPPSLELGISW